MSKRRAHYCVNIAKRLCEYIALGHGLPKALELTGGLAPSIPMFYRWLEEYPEFLAMYRRAREFQAHTHADRILEMAELAIEDPKRVPAYRLAADIFKWNAEMRHPETYSPKAAQSVPHKPKTPEQVKEEIARLQKELGIPVMPQPGLVTAPRQNADKIDKRGAGGPEAPPPNLKVIGK